MAERNLAILVTAKSLADRVLGKVRGDINGIEGAAKRASSNVGRNIAVATTAVAAGVSIQVKAGVDSLVELERVENLTQAALESTGNKAQQSVDGIRARAEAMENMTGVDDKVVQNAQNLLLTFTNVGKKVFEPTLESAINLNAALGGNDDSLQSILLQVAKAVNDPVKGMTALRRSGVSFTDAQVEQVKALVEANDLMGAQAIVLGELETQFGGAAEAANQGATRAQRRWTDGVEDIQKSLATGFMPLIERVSGKMQELVADPAFLAGVENFGSVMASGFEEAVDFAEGVDWGAVGSALQTMGGGARMAMDAFLGAPPWLQTAILTGWGLNKLTGGGLGSIVGALGSGLIKGVLGMNAGVVNAKAGVVNVAGGAPGGGGGLPAAGGKGGGFGKSLLGGLKTGAALAAPLLVGAAAVEVVNFENMRNEQRSNLQGILDQMPRTPEKIDESIARIQAQIDMERPFLEGVLFNTNVRPQLERQVAELQAVKASAATQAATQFDALSAVRAVDSSVNATGREQIVKQAEALAAVRATQGPLNTIAGKNFSPTINVTARVNSFVSINEWQRTAQSAQTAYSTNTGGI